MKKRKVSGDATPDVHRFSRDEQTINRTVLPYGTYEVQATADTDNPFPMIAPGLPKKYRDMKLDKATVEEWGEGNDRL